MRGRVTSEEETAALVRDALAQVYDGATSVETEALLDALADRNIRVIRLGARTGAGAAEPATACVSVAEAEDSDEPR